MQRSTKRRDNQMQDPQGGEFRMTARGTQLSSMSAAATFNLIFDLNGLDAWTAQSGDSFYTEVVLMGVTDDASNNMNVWTGKVFFSSQEDGGSKRVVPTGGALALDPQVGTTTFATPSYAGTSGDFQILMTVDNAADVNWVAVLKGLYATGDEMAT